MAPKWLPPPDGEPKWLKPPLEARRKEAQTNGEAGCKSGAGAWYARGAVAAGGRGTRSPARGRRSGRRSRSARHRTGAAPAPTIRCCMDGRSRRRSRRPARAAATSWPTARGPPHAPPGSTRTRARARRCAAAAAGVPARHPCVRYVSTRLWRTRPRARVQRNAGVRVDRDARQGARRDPGERNGASGDAAGRARVDVHRPVTAREQSVVRHDGRPREHAGQIARRDEGRPPGAEAGRRREPPRRPGAVAAGQAHAARRERRPSDVAAARAPGDPGRAPHGSRNPAPAAGAGDPAAVVKGRPTPAPVRDPGPTVLGQRPVAARRVGREAGPDDRRARRPDVAVRAVVVPATVWRERRLKLGVRLRVVPVVVALRDLVVWTEISGRIVHGVRRIRIAPGEFGSYPCCGLGARAARPSSSPVGSASPSWASGACWTCGIC